MFFSEFCEHFDGMNDQEIIRDVKASRKIFFAKIANKDFSSAGNTFADVMIKSAEHRIAKTSSVRAAAAKNRWNEKSAPKPTTQLQVVPQGKNTYGEFANVFLTTEEYLRLQSDFQEALDYVERLSAYLANNPSKAYANHYAVIRKWIAEDQQKAKEAEANRPKSFKEQERDRIRAIFADDEAVKRYKGEA